MADTRVFKIHYQYAGPEFCNYRAVVQKAYKARKGYVTRVEATNEAATEGWTDVTSEFFPEGHWLWQKIAQYDNDPWA